ncbi:MAG: hypothetical protein JWQ09_2273 [Segetibacter sp.]|nr:hypothetical protein [Segetibacter sp.]
MLFTLIACSIFLFLTLIIGNWLSVLLAERFNSTSSSTFQNFLLGFVLISCYLNLWSLFLPVNYYALCPVFILSIFISRYSSGTIEEIKSFSTKSLSTSFVIVAVPILLVTLVYALLPPQHGDSPGYHFLTIRWNEEYKSVHGLANLHGRLGFNSSFFVSSAAFAFSHLAGQPLYLLNIVFTICYYLWLINKIYFYKSSLWSIVFVIAAIGMFRQLIDSISSPTPDVLSTIIISYVFITIAETFLINNEIGERQSIIILLLICFAFTVKLNTFPLTFIAVFVFLQNKIYKSRRALLLLIIASFVILIPWIIRNYILTGYLIFPISATGFLHPDWKVPYEILHFEKLLINNGPKLISQNWEYLDSLSFTQWFPLWIRAHFTQGLTFSLVILVAAVVCAVVSLVLIRRKQHSSLFSLAVINIISISFWIYNSPDYRFGYPYLMNAVLLLSLFLTKNKPLKFPLKPITATFVVIVCTYYLKHAITILSPYPVSAFAIRPLQVPQYNRKSDLSNFPFVMLNERVKLYVEDKDHWCNMAELPCLIPYNDSFPTSQIKLRGTSIDEGFKVRQQ